MICLNCFHDKTKVTNSRWRKKTPSIWRRRSCPKCLQIFTTYEQPSLDQAVVLGRDGKTSYQFNLGKLTISISESFKHNPLSASFDSYFLAQTVQEKLLISGKSISADDIAALTHETLQSFDPIAALQYAAQHELITSKRRPGRPSTYYSSGPTSLHQS